MSTSVSVTVDNGTDELVVTVTPDLITAIFNPDGSPGVLTIESLIETAAKMVIAALADYDFETDLPTNADLAEEEPDTWRYELNLSEDPFGLTAEPVHSPKVPTAEIFPDTDAGSDWTTPIRPVPARPFLDAEPVHSPESNPELDDDESQDLRGMIQ